MRYLFLLFTLSLVTTASEAAQYRYYEATEQIDAMILNAEELPLMAIEQQGFLDWYAKTNQSARVENEKDEWVALGLVTCLGVVGAHRWYLGTSTGTKIAYCFIGGCLVYVDFLGDIIGWSDSPKWGRGLSRQ